MRIGSPWRSLKGAAAIRLFALPNSGARYASPGHLSLKGFQVIQSRRLNTSSGLGTLHFLPGGRSQVFLLLYRLTRMTPSSVKSCLAFSYFQTVMLEADVYTLCSLSADRFHCELQRRRAMFGLQARAHSLAGLPNWSALKDPSTQQVR